MGSLLKRATSPHPLSLSSERIHILERQDFLKNLPIVLRTIEFKCICLLIYQNSRLYMRVYRHILRSILVCISTSLNGSRSPCRIVSSISLMQYILLISVNCMLLKAFAVLDTLKLFWGWQDDSVGKSTAHDISLIT